VLEAADALARLAPAARRETGDDVGTAIRALLADVA
jgi:hypothetical protein